MTENTLNRSPKLLVNDGTKAVTKLSSELGVVGMRQAYNR